jgi:hypothetical protein
VTNTDALAALANLGFTDRDRLPLRFWFETSSIRQAVELAAELRTIHDSAVQMRPGAQRLGGRSFWRVVVRTPSTLLTRAVIARREGEVQAMAGRHGCRLIGWAPVVDGVDVCWIQFPSNGRPT